MISHKPIWKTGSHWWNSKAHPQRGGWMNSHSSLKGLFSRSKAEWDRQYCIRNKWLSLQKDAKAILSLNNSLRWTCNNLKEEGEEDNPCPKEELSQIRREMVRMCLPCKIWRLPWCFRRRSLSLSLKVPHISILLSLRKKKANVLNQEMKMTEDLVWSILRLQSHQLLRTSLFWHAGQLTPTVWSSRRLALRSTRSTWTSFRRFSPRRRNPERQMQKES